MLFLLLGIAGLARAETFGFKQITEQFVTPDTAGQYAVDVTAVDLTRVNFHFTNASSIYSNIDGIYFADGDWLDAPVTLSAKIDKVVSFDTPATPANLPGGQIYGFDSTFSFYSTDADNPQPKNGIDASNEFLDVTFTLKAGKDFASVIRAIDDGHLKIGLHAQTINNTAKSGSFMNTTPVPLPAAAWSTLGLLGMLGLGRVLRRKAA